MQQSGPSVSPQGQQSEDRAFALNFLHVSGEGGGTLAASAATCNPGCEGNLEPLPAPGSARFPVSHWENFRPADCPKHAE